MAAMIRRDAVIDSQGDADAGRHRLLPDRDMQRPRDFAGLVRGQRGLLEGADARHRRIEAGKAAQVVAKIADNIAHGGSRLKDARLAQKGGTCFNTPQETSTRRNVVGPQATPLPARLTKQECPYSTSTASRSFLPRRAGARRVRRRMVANTRLIARRKRA